MAYKRNRTSLYITPHTALVTWSLDSATFNEKRNKDGEWTLTDYFQ
jgi:hypothetical protein